MHHPLDVVDPFPVDGDARIFLGLDELAERPEGGVPADADHVHPRGHDLPDERIPELDDALEEVALVLLDDALLGGLVDEGLDLLLRGLVDLFLDLLRLELPEQQDQGEAIQWTSRKEGQEKADDALLVRGSSGGAAGNRRR